mmetsp:Transcript_11623/g.32900  ORF Transcript_11623/g.32900 Transcript_11623/m.32900 type:complete len:235 (-) Transcript_11623:1294-1998(-)
MSSCSAAASSFFTWRKACFFRCVLMPCAIFAARCSSVTARSSASFASAFAMSSASTSAPRAVAMASSRVDSSALSIAVCNCSKEALFARNCFAASSRRASSTKASTPAMASLSSAAVACLLVTTPLSRLSEQASGVRSKRCRCSLSALLRSRAQRCCSARSWATSPSSSSCSSARTRNRCASCSSKSFVSRSPRFSPRRVSVTAASSATCVSCACLSSSISRAIATFSCVSVVF